MARAGHVPGRWSRDRAGKPDAPRSEERTMSKPSIVFCHGLWADGSCFSKLIGPLQADGHQVMAAQYGLDTPEGDVAAVIRTLGRVEGPTILVGHSYGGSGMTAAGTAARAAC